MKALLEAAGIPFMVVGSFASTVHGKPRTTLDLDLVIDPTPTALGHFLANVDMDAFYVDPDALRDRSMFSTVLHVQPREPSRIARSTPPCQG